MFPSQATFYIPKRVVFHSEFFCYRPKLRAVSSCADLTHFVFSKSRFNFLMFLSAQESAITSSPHESHCNCVPIIPASGHPLQVFLVVILFNSVDVIYLMFFWTRSMKSFTDKLMHAPVGFFPDFEKQYRRIPVAVKFRRQNPSCTVGARFNASDVSETRHFVESFPSKDCPPSFNAILRLIHGCFLHIRKWFWLEPVRRQKRLIGLLIVALLRRK